MIQAVINKVTPFAAKSNSYSSYYKFTYEDAFGNKMEYTKFVEQNVSKNAQTYVGSSRFPVDIERGTNIGEVIDGMNYSGHALDKMQGWGLTPSVVKDTVSTGRAMPGNFPNTTQYYNSGNNTSAVLNDTTKKIITAFRGK